MGNTKNRPIKGAICDGFDDFIRTMNKCPNCNEVVPFAMNRFYDLCKCLKCGGVYEAVLK